ncbi:MAG: class I SAM-dependent methyltransferase [Gammaproteobacteria bacterium]|nr:class I SAM-dependent methyltransferase [Gammaproteobacteria bacterium]MBU1776206.1 class I SAM-dependent methyltransferase [Gammaproteobacteria bacterium]
MSEKSRVEDASNWYLQEQLDFDKRLIGFRYKTLRPHLRGPIGLELGPAEGQMTQFLKDDFESLTVVDGAPALLERIPNYPNLIKVHSLFEDFNPQSKFDTIVMEHILEHVDQPVELLQRIKKWLAPEGRILLGVPNGNSIHRLAATKMGLLKEPCELNPRDLAQGHRRVYTRETFKNDIEAAGLELLELGGVFFKPLSNKQIQDNWTEEMIQGFFELGKDFPEYAADIYAVCRA